MEPRPDLSAQKWPAPYRGRGASERGRCITIPDTADAACFGLAARQKNRESKAGTSRLTSQFVCRIGNRTWTAVCFAEWSLFWRSMPMSQRFLQVVIVAALAAMPARAADDYTM